MRSGWGIKPIPYSPQALCGKGNSYPTFCSAACVHEWRLRSDPGYARRAVELCNHGVCNRCGLDTAAIECVLRRALSELTGEGEWLRTRRIWEDGHRVAVVLGGGLCGLDNLRTLCLPCHRAATRDLQARRRSQPRAA